MSFPPLFLLLIAVVLNGGFIKSAAQSIDSGTILRCDTDCSLPHPPYNGQYTVLGEGDGFPVPGTRVENATILQYVCHSGYEPAVSDRAICLQGVWNTAFIECRKTDVCLVPPPPHNGRYSFVGTSETPKVGTVVPKKTAVHFSCELTHYLSGGEIAICSDGEWVGGIPTCEENKGCILPNFPGNGQYEILGLSVLVKVGQVTDEFTVLSFTCNDSYDLVGQSMTICRDKKWVNKVPQCHKTNNCILPEFPEKGNYSLVGSNILPVPGSIVREKETLHFACREPYKLTSSEFTTCLQSKWSMGIPKCRRYPSDCSSIPCHNSGIFLLQPVDYLKPFSAYCELDFLESKWTVIQYRFDGSVDFYRSYQEYIDGFGSLSGEFWLGLEYMHQLTKDGNHELYIQLTPFEGETKFARYDTFKVDNKASGYQLSLGAYSGSVGDAFLIQHNNMKFSTHDNDQDLWENNCGEGRHGGWWFGGCGGCSLNGKYYSTPEDKWDSVSWWQMFNNWVALKSTKMLIRRKD